MSNDTNETPSQGRKVGIARFFELLGRDLRPLYKSGILCVLGIQPGTALAVFGMMAGSALLTDVGGVVGGLVGGERLEVVNASGQTGYAGAESTVTLPASGVYIVRVGATVRKVVVK